MNTALRQKVLELMDRHGIGYFNYEGPDGALRVTAGRADEHAPIHAALAGVFLSRHPADKTAATWPRRVAAGEVIGWLKIGPLLEPVLAAEDALIRRPSLAEGALAHFGDRLF